MLKKILNLKGAQLLSKKEQNAILGGGGCGNASTEVCNTCTSTQECVGVYDGYGCIVRYICVEKGGNT